MRFQTSPPGTPVYCWFLLGVSRYLPLPGIYRSVGLTVMQLRKNSVSVVLTARLQLMLGWYLLTASRIFSNQIISNVSQSFEETFRTNERYNTRNLISFRNKNIWECVWEKHESRNKFKYYDVLSLGVVYCVPLRVLLERIDSSSYTYSSLYAKVYVCMYVCKYFFVQCIVGFWVIMADSWTNLKLIFPTREKCQSRNICQIHIIYNFSFKIYYNFLFKIVNTLTAQRILPCTPK